ncbi:hypothetical protein C1924_19195 [Stenotrophomonas sp. ESTM1D_MKCIP4_1]|nr:hypothetical protein C1924_19195 [Stenotrophomonas sp. ESTM1D_MKCIP4_1]
MAGGTGGPYNVGVARSWTIFSVAAATTEGGAAGLRPAPAEAKAKATSTAKAGIPWDGGALWVCGDALNPSMGGLVAASMRLTPRTPTVPRLRQLAAI